MSAPAASGAPVLSTRAAWQCLWAMVVGFFMILVDTTIVPVAVPTIMADLQADVNSVIWVTSSYLLAYAVPLLVMGRLGDRIGPRPVYLAGLAIFTAASLWCGLAGSITSLIIARVVQGLGASMMNPQTMAVITRIFPPNRRGRAMSLWGATAGVATLVGPLLGGVITGSAGWEWIFIINVPVGLVALVLGHRLIPRLPTSTHSFDWLGVALSGAGLLCLVFGIQEGETYHWGTITGILSVPLLIAAGLVLLAAFVVWQARNRSEPLLPLRLFRDRNFSLANGAITCMGFAITSLSFPLMIYAQGVRSMSTIEAAMLMAPTAVIGGIMAPLVGRLVDTVHPRALAPAGLVVGALAMWWAYVLMTTDTPYWQLLLPGVVLGFSNSFIWSPLSAAATRNLPLADAGAGSGVYNTTRQVGAVLGSAAIAAFMQSRLAVHLPGMDITPSEAAGTQVPEQVAAPFASAMAETMLLPGALFLLGGLIALFLVGYSRPHGAGPAGGAGSLGAEADAGSAGAAISSSG